MFYERIEDKWIQKVRSYLKVRTTRKMIIEMLRSNGFIIVSDEVKNGMISIIAQK